jgi:hypothetical protein
MVIVIDYPVFTGSLDAYLPKLLLSGAEATAVLEDAQDGSKVFNMHTILQVLLKVSSLLSRFCHAQVAECVASHQQGSRTHITSHAHRKWKAWMRCTRRGWCTLT